MFWGKFDQEMRAYCDKAPGDEVCACLREDTPVHPKCFDQRCASRGYRSRTYDSVPCQSVSVKYVSQ